jgi:hypothetical protein
MNSNLEKYGATIEKLNQEKSRYGDFCTVGRAYLPGAEVPYVVTSPTTHQEGDAGSLKATGQCSTCGKTVETKFVLWW